MGVSTYKEELEENEGHAGNLKVRGYRQETVCLDMESSDVLGWRGMLQGLRADARRSSQSMRSASSRGSGW